MSIFPITSGLRGGPVRSRESADESVAAVESGLQKLSENRYQEITPNEMFGLEAIVLRENRPVEHPLPE